MLRTDRRGHFSTQLTIPSRLAGRRLVRVKLGPRALGFFFTIPAAGITSLGALDDPPGRTVEGAPAGPAEGGPTSDPLIAAAGDIACDPTFTYFKNGLGTSSRCRQRFTSDLLVNAGLSAVLPLGDIQYECGGSSAFTRSYDPSWGRVKAITRPAPGNHEYRTSTGSGCDTSGNARGYFGYFGAAAGDPAKGYYSYDVGAWHLVALNSNCSVVSCGSSSAQVKWLRQDLAAHPARCTLGYWHHPRFTSGTNSPGSSSVTPLYQALYDQGADVVLVGHDHHYERFAPQEPNGSRNPARGIRQFLVGTGGRGFHPLNTPRPNSEVRNNSTFGVLRLTLRATSYDWQFVPEAGKSFRDSGSQACH
ncbi:MAG: metallophosphoesterase family protein [Solirubrobacterales bacterium]